MKKTVIHEYAEEDFRMLRNASILKNPCTKCPDAGACCGCDKGKEYKAAVSLYKDAGILEDALKVNAIEAKEKQLQGLLAEIEKLKAELPEPVRRALYQPKEVLAGNP